jgi:hypothetical protein
MYFLGFSRYYIDVNYRHYMLLNENGPSLSLSSSTHLHYSYSTYIKESLVFPNDFLIDVGSSVRITRSLTRLATKQTVEVRTNLVGSTLSYATHNHDEHETSNMLYTLVIYLFDGVALSTTGLEELSTSGGVT